MNKILDVGCGSSKIEGTIGMDHLDLPGVDIIHDLNDIPWPFESESVSKIIFCHSISHLNDISAIMIECNRILCEGGHLEILAPHYSSDNFNTDPTHKMSIGHRSMNYFIKESNFGYSYIPQEYLFRLVSVDLSYRECQTSWRPRLKFNFLKIIGLEKILNLFPRIYERFFCWIFPISEVYFVLKKSNK